MVKVESIPDYFFREIRKIEVYKASQYSFNDLFIEKVLSSQPILVFENIIPEEFDRSISRRSRNGNYYFDIDISFSLYNLNPMDISIWSILLNKKDFVVVLRTNTEFMVLGNDTEPLRIESHDKRKDDNTGTDKIEIRIFGETIIEPQTNSL